MNNYKTTSDGPKPIDFEIAHSDHPEMKKAIQKTFFPDGNLVNSQKDVDARVGDFVILVEQDGWSTKSKPAFVFRSDKTVGSSMLFRRKIK